MGSTSTLERKYQDSRGLSYYPVLNKNKIHRNEDVFSDKLTTDHRRATDKGRLGDKRELRNKQWNQSNLRRLQDTPIRSINRSSNMASLLQPTNLYKLFNATTPYQRKSLTSHKGKRYRPKREGSFRSTGGIFNRLRSYLKELYSGEAMEVLSDLQGLKASAKHVLNLPDTPNVKEKKQVIFQDDKLPARRPRIASEEDPYEDLLDEAASIRRKRQLLLQEDSVTRKLKEAFEREKLLNEQLCKEHEMRIKNLENSYTKEIERMNKEVAYLKHELSDQRREEGNVSNLQVEFRKEREQLLRQKEEYAKEIDQEKRRLKELSNDLAQKKEDLIKERKLVLCQKAEIEERNRKFLDLDKKKSEIVEELRRATFKDVARKLRNIRSKYQKQKDRLLEERKILDAEISENEKEHIQFFESIIEYSSAVIAANRGNANHIVKDFEKLLDALNQEGKADSHANKFMNARLKFKEYSTFFENFRNLYKLEDLEPIPTEYSPESLKTVDALFSKLQESFMSSKFNKMEKLEKLRFLLSNMDFKVSNTLQKLNYKHISQKYSKISSILLLLQLINLLMLNLASLIKQLHEILTFLDYKAQFESNENILVDTTLVFFSDDDLNTK